jgi:hypothetical protein
MNPAPGSESGLWARLAELASRPPDRIELVPFVVALAVSLAAAVAVAVLYDKFSTSRGSSGPLQRTFPLLAVAVTAIFVCIQYSLPLSLGLLGALSIVRFRAPIKETEEIGFILVVIATSLACATFNLLLVAGILGVTLAALVARRLLRRTFEAQAEEGSLVLAVDAADWAARGRDVLAAIQGAVARARVESLAQQGDEVVVALSFPPPSAAALADLERRLRDLTPRSFTLLAGR